STSGFAAKASRTRNHSTFCAKSSVRSSINGTAFMPRAPRCATATSRLRLITTWDTKPESCSHSEICCRDQKSGGFQNLNRAGLRREARAQGAKEIEAAAAKSAQRSKTCLRLCAVRRGVGQETDLEPCQKHPGSSRSFDVAVRLRPYCDVPRSWRPRHARR